MLEQLAGCTDGQTCDGVFLDRETGRILVRGRAVEAMTLDRVDGEVVAAIPLAMLGEAAEQLRG